MVPMGPLQDNRGAQIRQALRRMLDHPQFSRTKVLKSLLEYLVDRALANDSISESGIASAVFEIPAEEFHPYTHTNVRVQMHNLRKKLEAYYAESSSEPVRIALPDNSYCPAFEFVGQIPAPIRRTLNQARILAESRFPADLRDALSLADEVLTEAPALGIAWALRADIHLMLACNGEPPLENLKAAAHAAHHAVAYAPDSWEAHNAKAGVLTTLDWNWAEADLHFQKAAALGGGIRAATHPWRQIFMKAMGRADELATSMERLLEMQESPSHMAQTNYGICLHVCRRHADSERELLLAAKLFPSEYSALGWLATVQWTMGHKARALATQVKAMLRARRSPPGRLLSISVDGMRAATTGVEPPPPDHELQGAGTEMGVALTSIIFGRHEKAVAAFERMAAHRYPLLPFLIHLQLVDALWPHPRFSALIESLRLPPAAFRYRTPRK
jgi:tetratricopeptide (TPR) repeat protein